MMRGLGEIAERLRRVTAQVFPGKRGGGSGVVWSADGLILTNAHVARSSELTVELWDGRRVAAEVMASDPARDLAAVRIRADGLEAAVPGDSEAVRPGEVVLAVGSPLGFAGALSTGVVHSVGRLPGMGRQSWIRANVRLAPGNSGGPLADAAGRVIGLNTAIVNGLGIAAPIAGALKLLRRRTLGVSLRPLPHGLALVAVDPSGPAARSSLRPGDVLLCSPDDLVDALESDGEVLRVRFLRGEKIREVAIAA
jgi:serine protease Do